MCKAGHGSTDALDKFLDQIVVPAFRRTLDHKNCGTAIAPKDGHPLPECKSFRSAFADRDGPLFAADGFGPSLDDGHSRSRLVALSFHGPLHLFFHLFRVEVRGAGELHHYDDWIL